MLLHIASPKANHVLAQKLLGHQYKPFLPNNLRNRVQLHRATLKLTYAVRFHKASAYANHDISLLPKARRGVFQSYMYAWVSQVSLATPPALGLAAGGHT